MTRRKYALSLLLAGCVAASACNAWRPTTPGLPAQSMTLDQLVIYSETPLPKQHRLLDDLSAQRANLSTVLALPLSDEPIHVYLFRDADRFKSFVRVNYPQFPDRRAFFVETDVRLSVYAYWGDRVAEDLRHEVAHGYLHSVVPRLPLWLDEGLAEYFEVPRGQRGLNRPHVHTLTSAPSGAWQPNIKRLETLRSAGEMTQADYAESWAWVHFLLETTSERRQLLQSFLQSLRKDQAFEPLSAHVERADPDCAQKLVEHVAGLAKALP